MEQYPVFFLVDARSGKRTYDPRLSIAERYGDRDHYIERIRSAAMDLIRPRYMLKEDLERVLDRARRHWDFATHARASEPGGVR